MTDANGVAYCQITPNEKAGTYILTANFSGYSPPDLTTALQLLSASGSNNFVVNPEETTLTYTGPTTAQNGTPFTMTANLTRGVLAPETDNIPLNGEAVTMTLGAGTSSAQSCTGPTNAAGTATCTIPSVSQSPGSILVAAKFAGDDYYNMSSDGTNVNVPQGTQLTIIPTHTPPTYNTPSTVSAMLVNTNTNLPVSNESVPVTFEVNNDTTQTCTATTNASGVASCSITPNEPAGSYSLNVTFPGDNGPAQLAPTGTSSTFTVTPASTTLSYTGTTLVTNGQSAILSGVLTQTSSGTGVSGQTVTFTLGSQSCTATTLASGAATCTIPSVNQSPGSAGISASSSSGQEYGSSTVASSATVQSHTTLMVTAKPTDFADTTTVSATLTTALSPTPIANEPVTFKLSDNTVPCPAAMTNASGVASCSITPSEMAGTYTLTASFAGAPPLLASSGSTSFIVTLEETSIAYTGPSIAVSGMSFTMSANLTGGALSGQTDNIPLGNKAVLMTLGSGSTAQSCTGTTNSAGTASCPILNVNQVAGTVPISVAFAADAYYKSAMATATETTAAPPSGGGGFVIGDVSAGLPTPINGTQVNFWGSQLWKTNQFSGVDNAPASMKGYIDSVPTYACGAKWTSDPGNSSQPPATIPVNMVVVVASAINKSGSTESGNILHLVVVSVSPGEYGPAPGHDAWGKIIATIC